MIQNPCLILFGILLCSLLPLVLSLPVQNPTNSHQLNLIVDTDIGGWPDDVGAISMLQTYADRGLVRILAIMANNAYEGIVPVLDALNTYFGRPEIEIGITRDPKARIFESPLHWPEHVLANYPHPKYQKNAQAPDAVLLYRKILSQAPDQSITILSIGYLTNLANLLDSPADSYSPLSGAELVKAKVKKLVAMAGHFPSGRETNIIHEPRSSSHVLPLWPTPVTFVGDEVGKSVHCGGNLIDPELEIAYNQESPISAMWELAYQNAAWHKEHGHESQLDGCYDEVAALVAVKGTERYFNLVKGHIAVTENGTNSWQEEPNGRQQYVTPKWPGYNVTLVEEMNPLLER